MPRGIYPRRKEFLDEATFQNALSQHQTKVVATRNKKEQTAHRKLQMKAACLRYEQRHKAIRKERKIKLRYGITAEQYENLFQQQNGQCAICKKELTHRRLDVDHTHTTNTVRGLLCRACNIMIGLAKDRPEVLRAAADYLEVLTGISPPVDFTPVTW